MIHGIQYFVKRDHLPDASKGNLGGKGIGGAGGAYRGAATMTPMKALASNTAIA